MVEKYKNTDYIYAVTLVRIWEKKLTGAGAFLRLCESGTFEEVMSLAHEAGYPDKGDDYESMLWEETEHTYARLREIAPDEKLFDLFLIEGDYHNLKVLLREKALGLPPQDMLLTTRSRVDAKALRRAMEEEDLSSLPPQLALAAEKGGKALFEAKNPQLADLETDRARMRDELAAAFETKNDFLVRYFRMKIDLYNLRTLFRMIEMKKNALFAHQALAEGGTIEPGMLASLLEFESESAVDFYSKTEYAPVVEQASSLRGIEAACETFEEDFLKKSGSINFGVEPLVAYLLKKLTEIKRFRMLFVGKKNDIQSSVLIESLGDIHA